MYRVENLFQCHRYKLERVVECTHDDRVVILAEDTAAGNYTRRGRSRRLVAIKCFRRRLTETANQLWRCVLVNRRINHPCITQFHEIFNRPGYVCVAMEYVPGGNLRDYVFRHYAASGRGLSEETAGPLFCDVINGLHQLFKLGAINRQVKLEHVLLSADFKHAKLCDLLFARFANSPVTTKLGDPFYTCPEIWQLPEDNTQINYDGRKADIWSAGVLLYAMLFARFPFEAHEIVDTDEQLQHLHYKITQLPVEFPESPWVTEDCTDLITRMLCKQPQNRIGIEEIVEHRWFITHERFRLFGHVSESAPTEDRIREIIIRGTQDEASLD